MSGLKSRRRGYRGEYLLRDYLRKRGWVSNRVPSSGAAEGFKGDVTAEKDGVKLLFEVKNHSDVFKKIYELYAEHIKTNKDDVLAFVCPGEPKLLVRASTSLEAVLENELVYEFAERNPLFTKFKRTFEKLGRMQELVGTAEILALKDNNKPFLFVRYR